MLTETKKSHRAIVEPPNLPEVEYPPEVVERWRKEVEIAQLQYATGELKPMTAAEMAAELGIDLD